jgi:Alw26I/Eco31I/Esp3I family type II restriction endonuclease
MAGTSAYGGRGRPWHPQFVKYMEFIVQHPVYSGMPDAYYEPGRIQWEAPSNRNSGKFKDTHSRRSRWWAAKAAEIGVSTTADQWISRVAKTIHPTKLKPCKICGRELQLRYVYPQERFLARLRELRGVPANFQFDPLESISDLVLRLELHCGSAVISQLPSVFRNGLKALNTNPIPCSAPDWVDWLEQHYIPSEPRGVLSPGAMSNAPDRFDGFHCDNLCCRKHADKGRSKANLQTYVTDRRVFEYWSAGDWVAADRLMGLVRSTLSTATCRNGHPGPCAADHIGPISLGFCHRPRFQLLCTPCNSAKNNRMYLSDVLLLKTHEAAGETVVSWHSRAVWDFCKDRVRSDEHARRLSKLMRDNRHSLMAALKEVYDADGQAYLASLLELDRADFDVTFTELKATDYLTAYTKAVHSARVTKYAAEQKVRRLRVAFKELSTYFEKRNRNVFVVCPTTTHLTRAISALSSARSGLSMQMQESRLTKAIAAEKDVQESRFRVYIDSLRSVPASTFSATHAALKAHMNQTGKVLAELWDSDRYCREEKDDVD